MKWDESLNAAHLKGVFLALVLQEQAGTSNL